MRAEYQTSISNFLQEPGFGRQAEYYADEVSMHRLRGELRTNEPMSKHTSWRAGGYAERYYMPSDLQDLAKFIRNLPVDERIYFVGLGSNLLVRDGGLRGTVIAIHARLNDLALVEQSADNRLIYASAGVACAKVARFAALQNVAGAEFLTGIPGTVGGALAMNAGCYGSETWEIVERVQIIDRSGRISIRQPADYKIKYRSVALHAEQAEDKKPEWFAGGYFRLTRGDHSTSRDKIRQLLAKRIESQPLNLPNAGSVFRNPPGNFAARLIELCDLKGFGIGGAMVSPKHANFIVNIGNATATDIETLIMIVQGVVKKQTGVELMQEVRIIGDARSRLL